jgi:hypothetical protein
MYKFELPIGARVSIGEYMFLHSGGGSFTGEKCPLIIECSLSESQLLGAKEKSFNVQKYESGNEILAREIYLASGDITSAPAMSDAVSAPDRLPIVDSSGNVTPLSMLEAAVRECGAGNAQQFILGAIKFMKSGYGLSDICWDNSDVRSIQS